MCIQDITNLIVFVKHMSTCSALIFNIFKIYNYGSPELGRGARLRTHTSDVCINNPFKGFIKEKWNIWMKFPDFEVHKEERGLAFHKSVNG